MSILIAVGVAFVLAIALFKACWRVAEPNEALIISGIREHSTSDAVMESLGFKIVTGKGTLVVPGVQTVRRLTLDLREAELSIDCVTHQGIPLGIKGVVIFEVGDDFTSIAIPPAASSTSRTRSRPASTTSSPGTCGPSWAA